MERGLINELGRMTVAQDNFKFVPDYPEKLAPSDAAFTWRPAWHPCSWARTRPSWPLERRLGLALGDLGLVAVHGLEDRAAAVVEGELRVVADQVPVGTAGHGAQLLAAERGEEVHSPDHLRKDERFVEFVRDFDHERRRVAAVCHGPQLMMAAGIVHTGRTLTAWDTVQSDLRFTGAEVKDEPVVIDRNWVTSRKPEDLEKFSQAMLEALQH